MNLNLNYEGFETNLIGRFNSIMDGVQYKFKFDNCYGASVVKHRGSYGHKEDLWELAVLMFYRSIPDDRGVLCYNTPITNDVLGWLTDEEVRNLLVRIKEL